MSLTCTSCCNREPEIINSKFPSHYRFADISDAELDQSVTAVKEQMPDIGERMVTGALRSNGIHVP